MAFELFFALSRQRPGALSSDSAKGIWRFCYNKAGDINANRPNGTVTEAPHA